MLLLIVFLSGIAGTGLMSLFNFFVSKMINRPFRAPHVLNQLISRQSGMPSALKNKKLPGWIIHFAIGIAFAFMYYAGIFFLNYEAGFSSGIIAGMIFGLLGVAGWYLIFKFHPNPPEINLKKYLLQLWFAHVVFGFGVALVYMYYI